ncbi:MAG: response regulator [Proteobacteria bacterium]|nr:response regulator [Pseudomonadota bacterium]MBU1456010.1 response regulator [Pseudomonadota bacterium]
MALRSVEEGKIDSKKMLPTGSERILVLDDEKLIVTMVTIILEALGYTVYGETDSLKALEKIHSNPRLFDLVITDQNMPNLGGVGFSRQACELNPDLPIILCSGDTTMVESDEDFLSENRILLKKPLTAMALATAVRTLLDKR